MLTASTIRRTSPTAIIHSGGRQTIFNCVCGERHTCSTDWNGRKSKHVREWRAIHDSSCRELFEEIKHPERRSERADAEFIDGLASLPPEQAAAALEDVLR